MGERTESTATSLQIPFSVFEIWCTVPIASSQKGKSVNMLQNSWWRWSFPSLQQKKPLPFFSSERKKKRVWSLSEIYNIQNLGSPWRNWWALNSEQEKENTTSHHTETGHCIWIASKRGLNQFVEELVSLKLPSARTKWNCAVEFWSPMAEGNVMPLCLDY